MQSGPSANRPTPLGAVLGLTVLASIGTGVIWNGVPFIAEHDYGYTQTQTLALYFFLGVTYLAGAFTAGRLLRAVKKWLTPRAVLGVILIVQSAVCLGPWFVNQSWMLWIVVGSTSLLASFLWPIIESYLTAGRHGREMRSAIGWWNVVWTSAVAASMWFLAPFMKFDARLAIVALGGLNAVALVMLIWFNRAPGVHDEQQWEASITPQYSLLLQSARVLLPLSYALHAALGPLLPYLLSRLEVEVIWKTPVAATWMIVRVVAVAVMWRIGFWHGRWGTLLFGAVAMTGGFALIVLAPSLAVIFVGFGVFGAGIGIIYYAALYYAMSIGKGQVDAGGKHEGLIGIGYAIGPASGLIGMQLPQLLHIEVAQEAGIVFVVWTLVALAAFPAVRPYFRARTMRRSAHNMTP